MRERGSRQLRWEGGKVEGGITLEGSKALKGSYESSVTGRYGNHIKKTVQPNSDQKRGAHWSRK